MENFIPNFNKALRETHKGTINKNEGIKPITMQQCLNCGKAE